MSFCDSQMMDSLYGYIVRLLDKIFVFQLVSDLDYSVFHMIILTLSKYILFGMNRSLRVSEICDLNVGYHFSPLSENDYRTLITLTSERGMLMYRNNTFRKVEASHARKVQFLCLPTTIEHYKS